MYIRHWKYKFNFSKKYNVITWYHVRPYMYLIKLVPWKYKFNFFHKIITWYHVRIYMHLNLQHSNDRKYNC